MRPPEFTGGKNRWRAGCWPTAPCFNEAAGIHRRKVTITEAISPPHVRASMRPPEFTGGKELGGLADEIYRHLASMRPPEFTGGKATDSTP